MKKSTLRKLAFACLSAGMIAITSCGSDDEAVAAPEASFTSEVHGRTVTFTNTSTGEDVTYSWDFGDGETSTEESPVYTYAAKGEYVVKLTATNNGGSNDSQAILEISNIAIDGDFSDWEDVPSLYNYTDGEGGTMTEMKLENLGNNKLYVYLTGTSDFRGFFNIYLNTDGDATSGGNSAHYPAGMGAEYLAQGFLADAKVKDASIYMDNPNDDGWCWTADCTADPVAAIPAGSNAFSVSDLTTVDNKKVIEFSIDLSILEGVSETSIGIAINDVADTWVDQGGIPQFLTETSALHIYEFN